MLGYATGFYIVKKYFDEHRISEESMIAEPAETFLKAIES